MTTVPQPPTLDPFAGAWLVSEYVYNADGSFAGIVHQRRELRRLDNGLIRVIQHCEPQPELAQHPMGEFKGERVFDLHVDGQARRYLGPDVVGTGLTWGEGVISGRGVWPLFGHNFTSFSALVAPNRQITGGKFFNVSELIANVIGIAVPERETQAWPMFNGAQNPAELSHEWRGTLRTVSADGVVQSEVPLQRSCDSAGHWQESVNHFALTREAWGARERIGGSVRGIGKQYGWLFEVFATCGAGVSVELMEVLDATRGELIGLRHWRTDEVLQRVEVVRLKTRREM